MEPDAELRTACFLALDAIRAQFGDDLPYSGALDRGFSFRGSRVPFLSYQKGIYRARVQRGPAALSINTSSNSPYDDEVTPEGFLYAYREGPVDQADNRALLAAWQLQVPLVYFVGVKPGWYQTVYPAFVVEDHRAERRVLVSRGFVDDHGPHRIYAPPVDDLERRYSTREVKVRLHQARFRWIVIPAYREQCAICRLKEVRLLDAGTHRSRSRPDRHSCGQERAQPVHDPPPRLRPGSRRDRPSLSRTRIGTPERRGGRSHA